MSKSEVECLICHMVFKQLNRHLGTHGIDADEYRRRFSGAETVCETVRRQTSKSTRKTCQDPAYAQEMSKTKKRNYVDDPTLARRVSEGVLRTYREDLSIAQQISQALRTYYEEHEVSDETRQLISEGVLAAYQDKSLRLAEQHSKSMLGHVDFTTPEGIKKMGEALVRCWQDPEYVRKQLESRRKNWADPLFKERMISLLSFGWNKRPNQSEERLQEILDKYYPNEWKYVGGGEVSIGGKMPDFINVNGKKIVIEMFGLFWHDPVMFPNRLTEEELTAHYKGYGFDCLVFWEDVVWCDEELIVRKVAHVCRS